MILKTLELHSIYFVQFLLFFYFFYFFFYFFCSRATSRSLNFVLIDFIQK